MDQKTIYVEVERETSKSSDRKAKWENFCLASGGHLYVFCDNESRLVCFVALVVDIIRIDGEAITF
jgi:hypothetical protein